MSGEEITIRSVQHYLYCPHRWGLLEIDKAWAENVFVTKANLMHERVHDPERSYYARNKRVFTSVPVYQDQEEYNLYGVVDCLEATEDDHGVKIAGNEGKYSLCIVEYSRLNRKISLIMKMTLCRFLHRKYVWIMCLEATARLYYIMQMSKSG